MTTFDYWVFGIFGVMALLAIVQRIAGLPPEEDDDWDTQDYGW